MNIGIHGKKFLPDHKELINNVLTDLKARNCNLFYSEEYAPILQEFNLINHEESIYSGEESLDHLNLIITLGGDGTLLEAVAHTGPLSTPILGINIGRMGFLATISKENISKSLDDVFNENYTIENRILLQLNSDEHLFGEKNFALNDFAILKKDTSSMIIVHAYLNDEFINSYWADGIIVSTPTGSTGYSLSCGGPLILPGSKNFVVTPVSPHNLTTRPMVVPDDCILSFKVEGRSENFLTSLDSRYKTIGLSTTLSVQRAPFTAKLIKFSDNNYFKTIRQKLSWGADIRN